MKETIRGLDWGAVPHISTTDSEGSHVMCTKAWTKVGMVRLPTTISDGDETGSTGYDRDWRLPIGHVIDQNS